MSFSRGDREETKLGKSLFETTAPKRRKDSLQKSQVQYRIPDIQIHVPEEDKDNVYSEESYANSETEADWGSRLQRDEMGKTNSAKTQQSTFHTTDILSNDQNSSFVSITSLPDINNYVVIPNRDSSRNLPSKTNSSESASRSKLFRNIIQEEDVVSHTDDSGKRYQRRRSSLLSRETPVDKQRRKSVADLASFMQPRKSIVELTPAMQARISVFETVQNQQINPETETNQVLDQDETILERRKPISDEIPNMERRRSIRAEVLELERRYLSGDERSTNSLPHTRNEIQALKRRRSIRNEILSFERRGSMQEKAITPPRRGSREDYEGKVSVGNNKGFDLEKGISIREKIKEMDQREFAKETDKQHDDEYQQGKQKDTTKIKRQSFTSDGEYSDTEEQYIKSLEPYLKYRKSISALEPYFKHQSEALRLSSSVQEEIARCEDITTDGEKKSKSRSKSQADLEMQRSGETVSNLEYENSISDTTPFNLLNDYNFEIENPNANLNEREYQKENIYEHMHYPDSRISRKSSVTIRDRQLSSGDSRPIEKVDGDEDIIRKQLSEHQKSIAMDEMESIARKLSIDPLNGSERNLTETHLSEESYDISYGPNSLSNRSSLSLGDVQMSSKKNSISGSLSGQSDSLQTHEISNVKSLDNQTPDYHTDVNERRKSIALEVLDFISRRVSNAFDASKENPTFVEKDEEDYSLFPQDSISREETYQPQSGSTSDIDNRRVSRGSISGKGVSNPPRFSLSLEETKNSPRKSISQNSDKLDAEDIILYDQRRKSVTMDALNFMVRKFSSEPIPDHQSKKLNNNPEQEDDVHKSALDESSRRNSRSSVQSDHRLSRRSSLSIKDGNGLQRGSVTHESEQRSQRGSISSEYENKTKRNSFFNEANRSQRSSITDNDYSAPDIEPLLLDKGERSPRGSISSGGSHRSPLISKSIDEYERTFIGSVSSQDAQKSQRNSLYEDEVKSPIRFPEDITPNDTQELKYDSLKDETHGEQRRDSIGRGILGFIARRFSNVSENEPSNSIPSITVKEHDDSQAYESFHENQRTDISSSQNHRKPSLENQQRDSRFIDEEDDSSLKRSISSRDGPGHQRGSVSFEDNLISRKASTVSSKSSIVHDGQGSQRRSISAEEEKWYYDDLLSLEGQTSRRGSASADHVPQFRRESFSVDVRQMSPRGSVSPDGQRSIAAQDNHRYSRGSISQRESDNVNEISRSRRSSVSVEESYRTRRGSTIEKEQGSQRGSISSEYDERPRRYSISYSDGNASHRGSIIVDDNQRSRENSVAMDDGRSHKGSILDQVSQRSSRGSISLQETQATYQGPGSPRVSISNEESPRSCQVSKSIDEGQRSRSGSVSTQDRQISQMNSFYEEQVKSKDRPPEGALAKDNQDEKYDSLKENTYETERRKSSGLDILGFITRRFSNASENEHRNSIPSITVEEHEDGPAYEPRDESRRPSSSSLESYQRSSIDDHQMSRRDSNFLDEEATSSRKKSILTGDEHRSQRDSISSEDDHISRKSSIVSHKDKRSSKGSIMYDDQGSHRGSISADESKGYFSDSLSIEESQASRRDSATADYGRQSQSGSFSVEAKQISRRGSVSADDGQGSRKGSLSLVDHKSHHRQSLIVDDETYQSISDQDIRRSSTSSNRVSHKSPRGSLSLQDTQSLYQRSPRGSISTGDSHSSSQIPESVDERHEPHSTSEEQRRKSIGMDVLGFIARRFSNASENEVSNPIPSITTEEHRNSQSYESPHESRRSSISSSQNYNRSSIDNQQVSQRDATFLDEEAVSSRRSSISIRDGHRSHRGSLLAEDNQISRKGSTVSDKDKRSSKGSIMYDGQGSQRGSISADESKGYFNDSLSMEESQTSRRSSTSSNRVSQKSPRGSLSLQDTQSLYQRSPRGSISTGDSHSSSQIPESVDERHEPHSTSEEQRRKSIGMDVLGFIARRFSNASENEVSNPIPSITTEEHRNSQSYESSHERRESDSDPNDMYEKNMNCNIPNETPDVILHHHIQRSFSEETPEITDYGSDSESGSELNFDLALTEIESDIQSTIVENMNQTNKHKLSVHQNDIHFTNMQKDEGVTPDIYEALYGHIITLLTLPELGGTEHELCATFIPDVTLESSINDTEWIEISQKNQNITGSPASSINQMSSLTILDKKGGWTTVDAIQEQKKRKPLDSISTVTFCGCGFLGVYLVGAATYLQERAPHVLHGRLAGSSVGSLIATCLACDVPLEYLHKTILATADVAQKYFMGPFNPFFPLEEPLMKNLLKMIPEDGHIKASGRLFLSLTRATTLTNEIVSEYSSRDELVRAILCCCFLPFISGFTVPSFNGRKYIDGGMSNNMPLKGPNTLTINAFSGEFDICPEDPDGPVRPLATAFNQSIKMTNNNLTRLVHSLLPPSSELLDKHFHQGYSDAKKYFSL